MPGDYRILVEPVDYGGIWHFGWAIGLILCAAFFIRFKTPIHAALFYFAAQALFILEAPLLPYGDYTRAFQATAGQSFAAIAGVVLGSWYVFTYHKKKIRPATTIFVVLECLSVWYQRAGLMGWESFDLALVALCMFMMPNLWVGGFAVLTICAHHGTTALAILAVQFIWADWVIGTTLSIPLAALAFYHAHGPWLDAGERVGVWRLMYHVWVTDWRNVVFGTGAGSFMWVSLLASHFKEPFLLCAHQDFFQIAFEYGLVGLALFLYASGWLIVKAPRIWRCPLVCCVVFMMSYHPLRFFPSAFIIALHVHGAYKNRSA